MSKTGKTRKDSKEFSKVLLIQESVLVWIVTISFIGLAFYCVVKQYFGELPWLTAMVAFPWGAYGVSQVFYYKKSALENTKDGVKFESVIRSIDNAYANTPYPHQDVSIDDIIGETHDYQDPVG